mmetsp:Transcript_2702/g.5912  ORF Transcript_2702/g.5912 Transcript_2702/m.5912 type:complete len:269 (-) Transcript_2702:526-1332(-)
MVVTTLLVPNGGLGIGQFRLQRLHRPLQRGNGPGIGPPFRLPPRRDLHLHLLPLVILVYPSPRQQQQEPHRGRDPRPLPSFRQHLLLRDAPQSQLFHVRRHDVHFRFVILQYLREGGILGMDQFADFLLGETGGETVRGHPGGLFVGGGDCGRHDGALVVLETVAAGFFAAWLFSAGFARGLLRAVLVGIFLVETGVGTEEAEESQRAFPAPSAELLQGRGAVVVGTEAQCGARLDVRVAGIPRLHGRVGLETLHPPDDEFVRLDEFR